MKKPSLIMALMAFLVLTSCKKDRTCECTSTYSYSTTDQNGNVVNSPGTPQTTKTEYKKVRKSDLRFLCSDNSYTSNTTPNGNTTMTPNSSESEVKCKIK